jgi:hypothetical protein
VPATPDPDQRSALVPPDQLHLQDGPLARPVGTSRPRTPADDLTGVARTTPPARVVVVDDCSTAGTGELALELLLAPLEEDERVVAACGLVVPRHVWSVWERGRYVEYLLSFTFYKPTQDY